MLKTVEAYIDTKGKIHLLEPVKITTAHRVLITILEEPAVQSPETALLSEPALAKDWNRTEEDTAWSHLQRER